jgi:glycosyltransferase involved in cell wall biosynthesis
MHYFLFIRSLTMGGAERAALNLSKYLVSKNHEVTFVLLEKDNFYTVPDGVKILYLGEVFTNWDRITFPKYYFKLKKISKKWDPQSTCLIAYSLITVCLVGYFKKVNSHFTCLVSMQHSLNHFSYTWLRRNILLPISLYFYKILDGILVVSPYIKKEFEEFSFEESKIKVVLNPIDIAVIEEKSKEPVILHDKATFRFINVARLAHQKNQELLIQAFAKISRKDIALYIIGEGELEAALKTCALENGVVEQVHFLGIQENPFKFMSKCDCFVLSSDYEGLPNVLLEAMACGLPVVSTDCPTGPKEILSPNFLLQNNVVEETHTNYGEHGLIVPIRNPDALSISMKVMLEDTTQRQHYAKKAKARVKDFDIPKIFGQFEDIIGDIKNTASH